MKRGKAKDSGVHGVPDPFGGGGSAESAQKLPRKAYERELARLQEELVKMAEWVRDSGA